MFRAATICLLALWTASAIPCSEPLDRLPGELADRTEQRELVREFSQQAEIIVVVTALQVQKLTPPETAAFHIAEVLKGSIGANTTVTYPLSRATEIGCTAASLFSDAWVEQGEKYLLYVREGRLLRAGPLKRERPEITAREEIRLIRKTLKDLTSNNAMQRSSLVVTPLAGTASGTQGFQLASGVPTARRR
jgi:hypothetical protein